jgi:hypothetical protein
MMQLILSSVAQTRSEKSMKGVATISIIENTGRCPRCQAFITSEQLDSHACHIPIRRAADTIWLDSMTDGYIDMNGDFVVTAKGLDGTLYGFVICKHNPPHSIESRWLNGNQSKRPPDKLPMYL